MTETMIPEHPAKFSTHVLDQIRRVLTDYSPDAPLRILDPFAGVGGVHDLHTHGGHDTVGVEIQPEWADAHPRTIVGDATALPFGDDEFQAIVTSPTYGNRMADHHVARDPCKACGGVGEVEVRTEDDLGVRFDAVTCTDCRGSGLSKRNTYAHALRRSGAEPVATPTNAVLLRWGHAYRTLHEAAVDEWLRVLEPGALIAVNMSNHLETIRRGEPAVEHRVVEWWTNLLLVKGCRLDEVRRVQTRRNRQGANGDARVVGEVVIVAYAPSPRWR